MSTTPIRDDNLVLLFAGPAQAEIAERIGDIKTGARLLAGFVAATVSLWIACYIAGDVNALTGIVLWVASVITALSPIIVAMLTVEYIRANRDKAELLAVLQRYNRI